MLGSQKPSGDPRAGLVSVGRPGAHPSGGCYPAFLHSLREEVGLNLCFQTLLSDAPKNPSDSGWGVGGP